MNFMYCKPRPSEWTYSVVGYHSSLLSWKPGFESWYVRHQSGVRTPRSRDDSPEFEPRKVRTTWRSELIRGDHLSPVAHLGEAPLVTGVDDIGGAPRPTTELSSLVITKRLVNLINSIHHKWSVF